MTQPQRERFGRYELVSKLGRGGMAETWRARLLGAAGVTKPVLIKKVLAEYANDDSFVAMFISEARISATLSHGSIAQVFDFGRVDGDYFLAMEFVDGQPLNRVMKRALKSGLPGIPPPLASFIALEMCRGLHYAHLRRDDKGVPLGIVHRDISPDNVLLSYEGQVKIVDFGIAKARALRGFQTEPGVVKGKYLFFSPEQAQGKEVDARTDVWATGVVLYEMLCGQLPVSGPAYLAQPRLVEGRFPAPRELRPEIPEELDGIVMRALTVDPDQRFESAHAFGDALAGFLYSAAPRFSSMSVAYLLQELFRQDLETEGREVHVPPSFVNELALWRSDTGARGGKSAPKAELPSEPQAAQAPSLASSRRPWLIPAAMLGAGVLGGLAFAALRAPEPEPGALQPIARDSLPPIPRMAPAAPRPEVAPAPQAVAPVPAAPPARGSAVFPQSKSMVLDARRDLILVPASLTRIPLRPEGSYRVSEPALADDAAPVFFWLKSPVAGARGLQGTLSRTPISVSGGTQLIFFNLEPTAPRYGQAARWIQLENSLNRERSSVLFNKADVPSLDKTFELTGLEEGDTYTLSLQPQNNWARTRGIDSDVVSSVVCVGSRPGALGLELQPLLVEVGGETVVRGVNTLRCGFLDEDPSDNQGRAVVHVSARTRPTPIAAPELVAPTTPTSLNVPRAPVAQGSKARAPTAENDKLVADAHALVTNKQYREAELVLRQCVTRDPSNAQCYLLMGVSAANLNRRDDAANYYRMVLELNPKHPMAPRLRKIVDDYEESRTH